MTALTRDHLAPLWDAGLDEPVIALATVHNGPDMAPGLAAGGSEGTAVLYDAAGTQRHRLDLDDALLALAPSPDGTRIAALGIGSRRLWDTADGRLIEETEAGWSASAAWDAKSQQLAVVDGRRVRLLDRDGAFLWSSDPLASTVTNVLWPRGKLRVAASAYQGVTVFEPETDRITNTLKAPGAIAGLTASPNGRWIVGGSQDSTLHGWKVQDGTDFQMYGFPGAIAHLAFEDSGKWMACPSADVITCWDFSGTGPTGKNAALLKGHDALVTAMAWAPGDRRTLITGDEDGGVRLWRLGPHVKPGNEVFPVAALPGDADEVSAIAVTADRDGATAYVARRSGRVGAVAVR